MSDLQNLTALFRSPEAAVIANQAVQAAEIAARQGLASIRTDAQHRQAMVNQAEQAADTAQISDRGRQKEEEAPSPRRRHAGGEGAQGPDAPAPRRRIDLIA
jgi:hypothetical protein